MTVLVLALGIGASTTVFSLANWLVLRPVPGVEDEGSLVSVRLSIEGTDGFYFANLRELTAVAAVPGLQSVGAAVNTSFTLASEAGPPSRVPGAVVTSNYFAVLGQRLVSGRGFGPGDDNPSHAQVAIISDAYWRQDMGRDPRVIGQEIRLNGHAFTIVGVAAPGFRGTDRAGRTDVWVPLASFRSSLPAYPDTLMAGSIGLFASLTARRAPGTGVDAVRGQLAMAQAGLAASSPKANRYKRATLTAVPGLDVPNWQRRGLRQLLALLLSSAGLLLCLTVVNTAHLLLTRMRARRTELATRLALGASRRQVIGSLVAESAVLSFASGALAIAVAATCGQWLDGLVIAKQLPALSAVSLDWRVLAFAVGVSTLTCVSSAVAPAVWGSRLELAGAITQAGRSMTAPGRRGRRILTIAQVALAVALLTTGALLVRSLFGWYRIPLGFDPSHVLVASVDPPSAGRTPEHAAQVIHEAVARMRDVPGVSSVGFSWIKPFQGVINEAEVTTPSAAGRTPINVDTHAVSSGFLTTIGATFLAGSDFRPSDDRPLAPKAGDSVNAVVNSALARALFADENPVGRSLIRGPDGHTVRIVGVVADIRTRGINAEPVGPTLYEERPAEWGALHLRLTAPMAEVVPRLREAMRRIDSQVPLFDIEMLSATVDRQLAEARLVARAVGATAAVTAAVAALGLLGVLFLNIDERRREFAIRSAVGATPQAIAWLVAREALLLTSAGAALGSLAAAALSQGIRARLFGVGPHDPMSVAVALGVFGLLAIAVTIVPAWRASNRDLLRDLR